jgi:hypothetical protein
MEGELQRDKKSGEIERERCGKKEIGGELQWRERD